MRTLTLLTILAACGDSSHAPPDAPRPVDALPDAAIDECVATGGAGCFQLPAAPLTTNGGLLQLACTPSTPTQSTSAIALSGHTKDFTSNAVLAAATVDVYYASDLTTVAAAATSDGTGAYAMTLPAPVPSVIYARASHANEYDLLDYAVTIDVSGAPIANANLQLLSVSSNATFEANLGISDPPGSAYDVIFAQDCQGHGLANAIGNVSSTSSVGNLAPTFVPGTRVFYLDSQTHPQPRSSLTATNGHGFVVYGGTPGQTYYVQTWGFLDAGGVAQGMAGLRLVSEVAIASVGQTVLVSSIRANQSPH
jgi:hypothetical protein